MEDKTNETINQTIPPPTDGFDFDFSAITAYLSGNTTAIMNIGSIIAAVIIITILGVKANRKKKYTAMTRYYIMHILDMLKSEVLKGSESGILPPEREVKPKSIRKKQTPKKQVRKKPKKEEYQELQPHMTGVG